MFITPNHAELERNYAETLYMIQGRNIFLKGWRPYFWIALVIFAVYAQTLVFDLTLFDDNTLVVKNYSFLSDWSNAVKLFRENVFYPFGESSYYRPLLSLSLMLDAGLTAKGSLVLYHFSNIMYHIIAVSLFFLLLLKLQYKKLLSFFAALIFAVHPVFTQAVAWIPGRNDTLLAIFILASFLFFLKSLNYTELKTELRGKKILYLILHFIFFAFALLTKETAVVLPFVLFFYLLVIHPVRNSHKTNKTLTSTVSHNSAELLQNNRDNISNGVHKEKFFSFNQKILIPSWILIMGGWFFVRKSIVTVGLNNPYSSLELLKSSVKDLTAVINFIGKLIFPTNLSTYSTLQSMTMIYGILAIGILAILLFAAAKKRWGYISFGLLWFFAFLIPTFIKLNLERPAFFLEHRLYIPAFGFFIFLLEIGRMKSDFPNIEKYKQIIAKRFNKKEVGLHKVKLNWRLIAGIFLILIFSVLTMRHSLNYSNALSYWKNAVKTSPNSAFAHHYLGRAYIFLNRIDEAKIEFNKALELNPKKPFVHNNLGIIHLKRKMFREAEDEFKKELKISPNNAIAYYNLSMVYYQQGKMKEAEKLWLKIIEINPNYSKAYNNLALYYYYKKDFRKATYYVGQIFDRELNVSPQLSRLLDNLKKMQTKK